MISLIVSLYKSEKYLNNFFNNVDIFLKTIPNNIKIEFVVIANSPSETELSLLNSYASRNDSFKIHIVGRESLYASWNRGVSLSKGNILGFWNVDDMRYSDILSSAIETLIDNVDLVYFPFIYKRYVKIFGVSILVKRKIFIPPIFDRKIFVKEMHCGPFFLFNKIFFNKVGLFDEQFKIAGDFDWCVRAAKIGKFKLINKVAGIFYNYGDSLSGSKNPRHKIENEMVCQKNNI